MAAISLSVISACLLSVSMMLGQTPDLKYKFDVASVRPVTPKPSSSDFTVITTQMLGGPDSDTPERLHYLNVTLMDVLTEAFHLHKFQIDGPDWMSKDRFDIEAIIPPGATKEQVRVMLQSLLQERFRLLAHQEDQELKDYNLLVAKSGPRLTPSHEGSTQPRSSDPNLPAKGNASDEATSRWSPDAFSITRKQSDCPDMLAGRHGHTAIIFNGHMCISFNGESMATLATVLTEQLERPVKDMTGLAGHFDFNLSFEPLGVALSDTSKGDYPSPFSALPRQLGLQLESGRAHFNVLVIDHLQRAPTEN